MSFSENEMRGLLTGKCIPGDMKVNEELPSYLVRMFDALHEQVQKLAALAEERRVFIVNGAEMGYIQLPVFEDDPATSTYQRCLLKPKFATDAFIRDIKSKAELEGMVKGAGRVALEASKVYRAAPQNSDERSLHKVIGNFAHKVARIIREGEQS